MSTKARRRYGAILWQASADIDDAIRLVRAFDNPDGAVRLVANACEHGERWAVVDLETMRLVAQGTGDLQPSSL